MNNLLESSSLIRSHLGRHLEIIKGLDPLLKERRKTDTLRRQLINAFGESCGYCAKPDKIEAAHLIPLEIGATTTRDNLILLCRQCHRLYDSGYLSINAMIQIAEQWRSSNRISLDRRSLDDIVLPNPTITMPPDPVRDVFPIILQAQREKKYVKAINIIERFINSNTVNDAGYIYLMIKKAEITRRRSARGVVNTALRILQQIPRDKIPRKYLPVYYYELNYVHRLLGDHSEAASIIHQSAEESFRNSPDGKPHADYVAACVNEILCELSNADSLTTADVIKFEDRLNEMNSIALSDGGYWGGRWSINCIAHALQVRIKARDSEGSWKSLNRLRDTYYNVDLTSGWDAASRQTFSLLEGIVRILFPRSKTDLETGIGLMARTFLLRLGPKQRPEGIRDAGIALAIGLREKNIKSYMSTSKILDDLMKRTIDGTSVIWPWKSSYANIE